jgi:hypothetical protein
VGSESVHISFGRVRSALEGLSEVLGLKRTWILLDEWSEVPLDLQPYLADLLHRTVLSVPTFTVKIAAIEHRSRFLIWKGKGDYIGLELGADVAADLNLDDFLVFESDQTKSVDFLSLCFLSTSGHRRTPLMR